MPFELYVHDRRDKGMCCGNGSGKLAQVKQHIAADMAEGTFHGGKGSKSDIVKLACQVLCSIHLTVDCFSFKWSTTKCQSY